MWISFLVATVMVAHVLGECPPGYKHYQKEDMCLKVGPSPQNYDSARKICQSEGGDLAQLRDTRKAYFIAKILPLSTSYWMGVHDPDHNRQWKYIDGTPAGSGKPWSRGEPNNYGGKEFCVMVLGRNSRYRGRWNDGNCADKLNYVCEKSNSGCPQGYRYFSGDKSCLKASEDLKSFDDARKACQADGAELAQVKDVSKTRFINEIVPDGYWMGLHDSKRNPQWTYTDGTPLGSFHPWDEGEPNNSRCKESCVMVRGPKSTRAGKWIDGYCPHKLHYVCEKRQCPEGYSRYSGDNNCIKAYPVKKSYKDARQTCQSEGADMVQVRDVAKSKFISGILPLAYWMGLHDPTGKQQWTYVDGTPMGSYHPWNRGEPNNSGGREFCVMVHGVNSPNAGNWNDGYCPDKLSFVCEI